MHDGERIAIDATGSAARLAAAIAEGAPLGQPGRILWLGLESAQPLPQGPHHSVVQPLQPQFQDLRAAGVDVHPDLPEAAGFDGAVVALPRSRERAAVWIAGAVARLAPTGWLAVEGHKRHGADSTFRALRDRLRGGGNLSKAHGRIFWGQPDPALATPPPPVVAADGLATAPGVFAADRVDAGTEALIAALPQRLPARLADLGAGRGLLARAILAQKEVAEVTLVEADHAALEAARQNVPDPRAQFLWADVTRMPAEAAFDGVVTNPPFHTEAGTDSGLGRAFIAAAARLLSHRGSLWLVANRHLPYEAELERRFREWTPLAETPQFKVLTAARPRI